MGADYALNLSKDSTDLIQDALRENAERDILPRIWKGDHTVWKPEPEEIANRLGWLNSPLEMAGKVEEIERLEAELRAEGFVMVLLLGMGGSSLAPELFTRTFPQEGLKLEVLDSTVPAAVAARSEALDPEQTAFLVATKSGGTAETLSLFKYLYGRMREVSGAEEAGRHFIAITDPGSSLQAMAAEHAFRATFLNDPNIGGRYSALSYFGLVPAGLIGLDLRKLLASARSMHSECKPKKDNPAEILGTVVGESALNGRDKLTFVLSRPIRAFGDWVEQLIAESTGKRGRGIFPVVGEELGPPEAYREDRIFVSLALEGDGSHQARLDDLEGAGFPVVRLKIADPYALGGQFFLWEMATAIAGQRLGINPFDQPNVEAAKALARERVAAYLEHGAAPAVQPDFVDQGVAVFHGSSISPARKDLTAAMGAILGAPGSYVALQAYLPPSDELSQRLSTFRQKIRDHTRYATSLGYGPRFLHSTGQLHKGDAGKGLFIQLTAEDAADVAIPDQVGSQSSALTFGVLKAAQSEGDRQALLDAGRRVVRFHLGEDVHLGLDRLMQSIQHR